MCNEDLFGMQVFANSYFSIQGQNLWFFSFTILFLRKYGSGKTSILAYFTLYLILIIALIKSAAYDGSFLRSKAICINFIKEIFLHYFKTKELTIC